MKSKGLYMGGTSEGEIRFGESQEMAGVASLARIAAENDYTVLITGETGTGKGALARWIHRRSSRSGCDLVEINCVGIDCDLFARELFGYAWRDFHSERRCLKGLLDAADRGTLFLDEVGEMDIALQSRFIRLFDEKIYFRVGDKKARKSDFRLIAVTSKCLEREIRKGAFLEKLYFHLNLLTIHIPPLRERPEDIPDLARHLLSAAYPSQIDISEDAMCLLTDHSWPGNVRELNNVLKRALILSRGRPLTPMHFNFLHSQWCEEFH